MSPRRVFVLLAVGSLLAACSGSTSSASTASDGTVNATLKEWQINLSSTTVAAGPITFKITNDGDKEHEFVVRKTDLKADSLPKNAEGEISEDAPELTEVGDPSEAAEIKPGSSDTTLALTLQPGHYVIFCNLHVEDLLHYEKGMHVDLTVN